MSSSKRVYWPVSSYYFFHFALAGGLYPYLAPYLLARGFDAAAVGELFAALTITKVVAPYGWAWLADRQGAHLAVVRWTALAGTLVFAGVVMEPSYGLLVFLFVVHSIFWNGTLAQFEALTLAHLAPDTSRYPRIRLWGSIGYIVTVAGFGAYFELGTIERLPWLALALFAATAAVAWLVRSPALDAIGSAEHAEGIWTRVRRPQVLAFLVAALLMQMSHGPYYAFYTVYLETAGYDGATIGAMWALGVVAEIGLFLVMGKILARYPIRGLLIACLALTALRWMVLAYLAHAFVVIALAQLLHAVSYGAFHAISMILIRRHFEDMQGRGQAIYAAVSFGLGGAAGSLGAGYAWSEVSPSAAFVLAALTSLVAGAVAWRWIR